MRASATTFKEARIIRDATDRRGRYGAAKLAELLDWQINDIAKYLGRAPSTISASAHPRCIRRSSRRWLL
jgi:hypothetical protein